MWSWVGCAYVAASLTIAAASDLQYALKDVAARFEQQTGTKVRLTFGSSGTLFAQIANGAPFDLFFSADTEYPKQLADRGLADRASLVVHARGRIVLWVPQSSTLDLNRGLTVLLDPAVRKIAFANPQYAPYGRAAEAAMRHEAVYAQLTSKFVLGENVAQTMHFVESGNADAGFVGLSLATAPPAQGKGRYWVVPQDYHPPIDQAAIVIARSAHKKEAAAFLEFLRRPEIVELMERYGFEAPRTTR